MSLAASAVLGCESEAGTSDSAFTAVPSLMIPWAPTVVPSTAGVSESNTAVPTSVAGTASQSAVTDPTTATVANSAEGFTSMVSPAVSSVGAADENSATSGGETIAVGTGPLVETSEAPVETAVSSEETVTSAGDDPSQPVTIWIAGDSTVANGNTPCPRGWGKHLEALFDDKTTVRNSAAGGRSVRTWAYEVSTEMGPDGECLLQKDTQGNPTLQMRWQEMLDNMKRGDLLLIQFGVNDGSPTCDRHVGVAAFQETYGVLVGAAKERGADAVLLTPVSAIACNGNVPQPTRGAYVDATLEVGRQLGVPVLDLHARSIERYAELGFCPVAGGDVSASTGGAVGDYFCDDHTHFSDAGAMDMAALVVELMEQQNVGVVSHLK